MRSNLFTGRLSQWLIFVLSCLLCFVALEALVRGLDLFAVERQEAASIMGRVRAMEAAPEPSPMQQIAAQQGLDLSPPLEDQGDDLASPGRVGGRWILHPFRGITPRPGQIPEHHDEGFGYNSLGIYSRIEDPRSLNRDSLVVGIFGGSVARGLVVKGGEELADELARRFPEQTIEVVNFGVSSYKQPQQVQLLSEILLLGVPVDVVVNLDGFNEVVLGRQDFRQGRHPLYPRRRSWVAALGSATGSLTVEQVRELAVVYQAKDAMEGIGRRLNGSLWRHSEVVRALWGVRLAGLHNQAVAAERRLRQMPIRKAEEELWRLDLPCAGDLSCPQYVVEVWARASRQMAALAASEGLPYFHVLQPNQYLEGSKVLTPRERQVAWQPDHPWSQWAAAGYPALRLKGEELKRSGMRFFDATQLFSQSHDEDYVDTCCHLTPLGYRKLGREMGRWIASHIVSEEGAGSETATVGNKS